MKTTLEPGMVIYKKFRHRRGIMREKIAGLIVAVECDGECGDYEQYGDLACGYCVGDKIRDIFREHVKGVENPHDEWVCGGCGITRDHEGQIHEDDFRGHGDTPDLCGKATHGPEWLQFESDKQAILKGMEE